MFQRQEHRIKEQQWEGPDEPKKQELMSSEIISLLNECLACQNKLSRPHTLPCGYTVCQSCYNNNYTNKLCISPTCQLIHTTRVQTNITMDKIQKVIQTLHHHQKKDHLTRNMLRIQFVSLLECPICCSCLYQPCTATCGHSFCQSCLVRSLDHTPSCPICRESISWIPPPSLLLCQLVESLFSQQQHMDAGYQNYYKDDNDNAKVPILVGSLVFPYVQYVIHIFEPRYRLMLRRIMESRRQRFAVCLTAREQKTGQKTTGTISMPIMPFYEFGTMLELTHVQTLEDGRSIVHVIASHRFRVLNYNMVDGYHVGELDRIDDIDSEQEQGLERKQIMWAAAERSQRERQQQRPQRHYHDQQQITSTIPSTVVTAMHFPNSNSRLPCRSNGSSSNNSFDRSPSQLQQERPRPQMFGGVARQQQKQPSRKPCAAQAHLQTRMSRSPWLQMHLRGLSPSQKKPSSSSSSKMPFEPPLVPQQHQHQQSSFHHSNKNVTMTNIKNEEISTDDLIQQIETFITLLRNSSNSNNNNASNSSESNNGGDGEGGESTAQKVQLLQSFDDPPPIQGPRRDRITFIWWVANMIPINQEEKAKLLSMRTLRERVLLLIEWIDRFKEQWSYCSSRFNDSNTNVSYYYYYSY